MFQFLVYIFFGWALLKILKRMFGSRNVATSAGPANGSPSPAVIPPTILAEFDNTSAICPIRQEIFQDPVIAADGFTYERQAIQQWFSTGKKSSPMTNKDLPHLHLVPNRALQDLITHVIKKRTSEIADKARAASASPSLSSMNLNRKSDPSIEPLQTKIRELKADRDLLLSKKQSLTDEIAKLRLELQSMRSAFQLVISIAKTASGETDKENQPLANSVSLSDSLQNRSSASAAPQLSMRISNSSSSSSYNSNAIDLSPAIRHRQTSTTSSAQQRSSSIFSYDYSLDD